MAKKESVSKSKLPTLFFLFALIGVAIWGWNSASFANLRDRILQYVDNRDIVTLEARFTPEQIVEMNKAELLGKDKRTLKGTSLKYVPYLLLDVKYVELSKTREGVLLWGLNDGEMVISTDPWEITHGFKDCLEGQANRNDFKLLQALAKKSGSLSIDELQKDLHIEREELNSWIESAKQKHLIVQKGNTLQLHFENPHLLVVPQTKFKNSLVTKPIGEGQKMARNYGSDQIISLAKAAFGNDYTIRSQQEIFLPVYSIEITNADGSTQVSDWNALTGKRITPYYLSVQ